MVTAGNVPFMVIIEVTIGTDGALDNGWELGETWRWRSFSREMR